MAYVGASERREKQAERFNAAPAPMTAKCIMRDEMRAAGLSEDKALELVAAIVLRLASFEYHIEQAHD